MVTICDIVARLGCRMYPRCAVCRCFRALYMRAETVKGRFLQKNPKKKTVFNRHRYLPLCKLLERFYKFQETSQGNLPGDFL